MQTLEQPITKPEHIADTADAVERYKKLVGSDYVRADESGKPDPKFKKFFYQIAHIFPSYFGRGNTKEVEISVQVQKYWKVDDKNPDSYTVTPNEKGGGTTKKSNKVIGHVFDSRAMVVNCLDEDAEQLMKCRDFEKQFIRIAD